MDFVMSLLLHIRVQMLEYASAKLDCIEVCIITLVERRMEILID